MARYTISRYAPLTASFSHSVRFRLTKLPPSPAKFLAISLFLFLFLSISFSFFFFRRRSVSCVQGVSIDLLVICTLVECCCMCWLSIFCTGEQYIYIYIVWRIIKKMLRIVYRFKQPPLDQTIERISRRGDLCSCERSLPSRGEKLAFGHPHDRFFFPLTLKYFPKLCLSSFAHFRRIREK